MRRWTLGLVAILLLSGCNSFKDLSPEQAKVYAFYTLPENHFNLKFEKRVRGNGVVTWKTFKRGLWKSQNSRWDYCRAAAMMYSDERNESPATGKEQHAYDERWVATDATRGHVDEFYWERGVFVLFTASSPGRVHKDGERFMIGDRGFFECLFVDDK